MRLYTLARSAYWRFTGYPADAYRHLLTLSQHWTRGQLEEYRLIKLQRLVTHCYQNVPYYRDVMKRAKIHPTDVQRPDDIARFPVLTKDIIRNHAKQLMADNITAMRVTWSKTGGTTGEPVRICKNMDCKAMEIMCYERGLGWGGLKVDAPRIRLTGGSLGLDSDRVTVRLGGLLRRNLFLPAFELTHGNAIPYIKNIERSRARFLIGYASAIYSLALLTEAVNRPLQFDAVFPTAELLIPEWEEAIRNSFKCKIMPYYGCGEVHSLGFHKDDSGYLIPEEHALVEVMGRDGSTRLYGEGRFLITDLDNYAMPIIRYSNGDAGKIAAPNGQSPFSRIERLDGRYNSLLMTDRGDLISGVIGTHVFRHTLSVKKYQIVQEEPLRVVIKVAPKTDLSDHDRQLILALFSKYLGSKMKISIEIVPDLPTPESGKSVFVINRCLEKDFDRSVANN